MSETIVPMSDNKQELNEAGLPRMKYCVKCVYPASSAVPLAFDENGICSGCERPTNG